MTRLLLSHPHPLISTACWLPAPTVSRHRLLLDYPSSLLTTLPAPLRRILNSEARVTLTDSARATPQNPLMASPATQIKPGVLERPRRPRVTQPLKASLTSALTAVPPASPQPPARPQDTHLLLLCAGCTSAWNAVPLPPARRPLTSSKSLCSCTSATEATLTLAGPVHPASPSLLHSAFRGVLTAAMRTCRTYGPFDHFFVLLVCLSSPSKTDAPQQAFLSLLDSDASQVLGTS